jgi:hypothetical protein
MALSDDQRAMLRLLAQREQGYEDIAALMGLSVDEVRGRVKDALDQLREEGVAPPAPPQGAEPAAPEKAVPAKDPTVPEEPVTAERAELPATPKPPVADEPEPPAPTPSPPPVKRPPSSRPRLSLPKERGPRAAIAAGVAVVILVVVVLLVSGSGGGSSGATTTTTSSASSPAAGEATSTAPASSTKEVTQAVLSPVGGGNASGAAVFGRVKNSLALQIEAQGLTPSSQGQSYTVWLANSPKQMLPLGSATVGKSGKLAAQVNVPTEVLAYLAKGTFDQIVVSQTTDTALKASLTKATSEKKAPAYTGTDVLQGTVTGPIVGAANKAKK